MNIVVFTSIKTFRTETVEEDPSFGDILKDLGSAFLTLPLIATLSQIAIAKAFCESRSCFTSLKAS